MRRLIPALASVFLLAACSGSAAGPTSTAATPAPSAAAIAPTAAPTATPAPKTTPSASASPSTVTGLVTYDGKTCTYTGPTVLREGAKLQVQFAPAAETYTLNWAPAIHGTTLAQLKKDDGVAVGPDYANGLPEWAWAPGANSFIGSGAVPLDLRIYTTNGQKYDGLVIACAKSSPAKNDATAVNLVDLTTATLIAILPE